MNKKIIIYLLVLIVLVLTASAGFLSTTIRFNPSGWENNGSTIRTLNDNPIDILGNVSIGGGFDAGGIDLTTLGDILLAGDILIQGDILTIMDQEINGSFLPTEDNKYNLGSVIKRWKDFYLSGNLLGGNFIGGTVNATYGNFSKSVEIIGNLNMNSHNITEINQLIAPDGSAIRFSGPEPFTGMDIAINIMSNQELPAGEISHAFTDLPGEKILRTWQVGFPDAGGFMRNSQIISSDFGIKNATKLSRCSEMAKQQGIDLDGVGCNTSSLGASLFVEGSIRLGHKLAIGGGNKTSYGIVHQGFADFNMEGSNFNIFNGSLHPFTPRIEEIGIATGGLVTMIDEDFEDDSINPFQKREQIGSDFDNWDIDLDPDFCFDGICARARGGDSRHPRIMEHNVSTTDRNKLNISFWIGAKNIDTIDNLSVQIIDGANSVMVYNFTGTGAGSNDDISPPELVTALIPSSFDDKGKISIRFNMSANVGGTGGSREEFWVDNVILSGTATASTRQNVTRRDTIILLGNGNQRIFWNDSSKVLELPPNVTIISETIQDLIVSGTLSLGDDTISDFDDLSVNNTNVNLSSLVYANGPVPCPVNTAMIYTNGTTSICSSNITKWHEIGSALVYTGGNVGIGTTTPLQKLVVIGTVNITDSLNVTNNIESGGFFIGDGSLLTGITSSTSVWNSSGSNVYLNDSTGRLGIGKIPIVELDVVGNQILTGDLTLGDATGDQILAIDGDSQNPTYAFADDVKTGMYSGAGNRVTFVSFGAKKFEVYANGILVPVGAENVPSIGGLDDTDTGLAWGNPANSLMITVNNQEYYIADGTGAQKISIYNEDGDDIDFRVETNNEENMFFIDGGNDRIGIGTNLPLFPLDVQKNVSGISIYASGNISATDYITRTNVYDKNKGKALDYIKDTNDLTTLGKIDHKKFYGYVTYDKMDLSRPVIILKSYTEYNETSKKNVTIFYNETSYPYTKKESGVSLGKEVSMLRQSVYELKTELCIYKVYSWC